MSEPTLWVEIAGLRVHGRHGVLPAERELGQPFVIDLRVGLASDDAAATDALADTLDYASLADDVAAIVAGEPVELIERLAGLIADRALAEPCAREVEVTVRKPHAPVRHPLREVAVTLSRTR